jgi:myosin heavy subunit
LILAQEHAGHADYGKHPKTADARFQVKHYAGEVEYQIADFLDKNRDRLNDDLTEVCLSSSDPILAALFKDPASAESSISPRETQTTTRTSKSKSRQSLGTQFRNQLSELMHTLTQNEAHFVRCIKPNSQQVASLYDARMCLHQIRNLGIEEVVRIRQLGYPIRTPWRDFWARYWCISATRVHLPDDVKQSITELLSACQAVDGNDWRVGTSRVFVRGRVHAVIEDLRERRVAHLVTRVQALVRMRRQRRMYRKMLASRQLKQVS